MSARSARQYLIELDGGTYLYHKGRFSQVADVSEVEGESWLVTDFPTDSQSTISRVTTVETSPKYANIMVGKRLQEEGEFTEPVQIINHLSRKRGRHNTEVFFTALTHDLFHHYQDRVTNSHDNLLVFPLYTLLLQISRKIADKQPVALVFRHGCHADLLIADHKTVYYANRATIFDQSEEQVLSLWEIIGDDIETAEREKHLSVSQTVICNWFDAPDKPDWIEQSRRNVVETPSIHITVDGESRSCSLLPMLDLLTSGDSISPAFTKLSCRIRRWLPMAQIAVAILAVGLLAGAIILQAKTDSLQNEIVSAKQQLEDLTSFSLAEKVDYRTSLELLSKLDRYRSAKTFKAVINDLSAAVSDRILIEQVKAEVQGDYLNIQIRGTIDAGFQTAYQDYQQLIRKIQQNSYQVIEKSFNTEIDQAEFLLIYTSPIGEGQ
ncbi:MAG: hypothetical protein U9R56_07745 [candidate division Zixibacteria bacterium]|nr:hypothetical protein [candidate division Zixibacteria bacterium]